VAPLAVARGVQNKVLEALAAGLPCVVTPMVADGLPVEVMPGCRTAEDLPSLVDAIVALLDTPAATRREIAASADLSALSWEQRLRPAVDLLRAAASGVRPTDRSHS
jgi:glycosyltransferase involved in cell wall biosynthesis